MTVRLNLNERHQPLPPDILAEIHRRWRDLATRRYTEDVEAEFLQVLEDGYGFQPGSVFLGAGGDEAIQLLCLAARGRVGKIVFPTPTFGMYSWAAKLAGIDVNMVPFDPRTRDLPVAGLLTATAGRAALVFICRPNNPTGQLWSPAEVLSLVDGLAPGSLVVLDEAYWEYAGESAAPWALQNPRIALLRTFSKIYGLAGLRCGYSVVPETWREAVAAVRMPFNVSAAAMIAAQVGVGYRGRLEREALEVAAARDELINFLKTVPGARPFDTRTNFVLIELAGGAAAAAQTAALLRERGILVRTYAGDPAVAGCIRVSIGAAAEMQAFRECFSDIMLDGNTEGGQSS
ncbi:MAG: histidinol-phosphate transaminase [Thermaerobacterales bacterium]